MLSPVLPPAPTQRSVRGNAGSNNYRHLKIRVRDAGLLGRRTRHYLVTALILAVLLGGAVTGFVLLGESWFQLLIAAGLGIILTQFAFLTHEAAHRQILTSATANDKIGRFLANVVVGISYQWWMNKHSKHHAMPNTIGKDPDIEWDTISFQVQDAQKQTGILKWITERQGYLFFPLLTLEGINLHFRSMMYLVTGNKVKGRAGEITAIALRLSLYLAVLFVFLPAGMAAAFLGVQLAVFGVYMGASFAPNHKGMPMIPKESRIDFFSRQVLTSRNVMARSDFGNRILSHVYGGLNYQVEHHLFPSMPRANLPAVAKIVREYCDELKVPYTVATPKQSYAQVISHLNKVGLSARDPFDCPMVSEYRPF
ncbi:fatty acid desaturase family protein [Paeniglutamicibacter sp. NPDC091659]|uniref:fatty acid desaturase family protein n=1 Tax=Paeniglutamicibacter sp. NPDC091659 TaxID=3364389 RepID=UPI0037F9505E